MKTLAQMVTINWFAAFFLNRRQLNGIIRDMEVEKIKKRANRPDKLYVVPVFTTLLSLSSSDLLYFNSGIVLNTIIACHISFGGFAAKLTSMHGMFV